MALKVPLCVECKKEVLNGTLRSGNRWVCNVCEPQDPDVSIRFMPGYDTDSHFVVTAIVNAAKPCLNCGYLWYSKAHACISTKDLEEHGMKGFYLSEIEHSPRQFVEGKRAAARNKALEHFKKPMPTCYHCEKKKDV